MAWKNLYLHISFLSRAHLSTVLLLSPITLPDDTIHQFTAKFVFSQELSSLDLIFLGEPLVCISHEPISLPLLDGRTKLVTGGEGGTFPRENYISSRPGSWTCLDFKQCNYD